MAYNHGVRVLENPTSVAAPITGTAGLQVVVGVAPVNLAEDPYGCTNVPMLANTFAEAAKAVGYSDDFSDYNICEAIDASFRVAWVGPIVLINVLDPNTHYTTMAAAQYTVEGGQVTIPVKGSIIRSEQVSNDMYVSIDLVEEIIEKQLKKYKKKIIDRSQGSGSRLITCY